MRGVASTSMVPAEDPSAIFETTNEVIDEVIRGIQAAQARHGFALTAEVGRLILEKLYGGDPELMIRRGPKDSSLRKLAEHPALPMSATTLHYSLGVYLLLLRRPDVHLSEHLTPTHLRVVLPLPSPDQDELLARAETEGLTVAELTVQVRQVRENTSRGGGRPRLPAFVKSIHAMERFVRGGDHLFGDLDEALTLSPDEARDLYDTVTGLRARCEALQQALRDLAVAAEGQTPGPARSSAAN